MVRKGSIPWIKGKKHSEETRRKISESHKGKTTWMKGRIMSEEQKKKISDAHKGKHLSDETKQKLSDLRKGKPKSEEHKRRISEANKGSIPWIKGKKHSEETKFRMSKARKGLTAGSKHPNWLGGISFEPYTTDWNASLKRAIRERDRYTCRLCGKQQTSRAFCVHHIDYDKKNCNPDNLITLCKSCHIKTNTSRGYWREYFSSFINLNSKI